MVSWFLVEFSRGRKRVAAEEEPADEVAEEGNEMTSSPAAKAPRQESLHSRVLCDPTDQSYLEWKERTIRQAKLELGILT